MSNDKSVEFLPLSVPNFCGNEKEYVEKAVVSEWVSTGGSMVGEFEQAIADYNGVERSVATASGTAALHLALICLGAKSGDEVLVPTLTFVAAVNPVKYVGAKPIFFDCDENLCIDVKALRNFCEMQCDFDEGILRNKKTGRKVSGIIPVHVFGNLADMDAIMDLAHQYNLFVLEDATEALGSRFESGRFAGKMAGTVGDFGAFSFNGNKLITTGSGGALVATDSRLLEHAKYLSTQAKDDELHFVHDEIGYNYRMTNLQAALGLAQMENLEQFIERKNKNYELYRERLEDINGVRLLPFRSDIRSNRWFYSLAVEEFALSRDELMTLFHQNKIGVRPIWTLIHTLKPYSNCDYFGGYNSKIYRDTIINLPCSTSLDVEGIERVCSVIREAANK